MGDKDVFCFQNGFIISEADKKSYRHLVLENGLNTLLIHEPEGVGKDAPGRTASRDSDDESADGEDSCTESGDSKGSGSESDDGDESAVKLSAAALCIGSGSAHEEAELPGLAHYLEHMVLMGSRKYPEENDFDAFIDARGGSTNAWTDMEQTMFHFDVQQKSFAESVDKFAHFFVDPLLLENSLEREVQAVHSEFEMACTSVDSQLEFFLGCLVRPEHPLWGFKWGNKESLWSRPRAAGVDVRSRLQRYRERHYSAPNMTLALHSRLPLDELEAIARKSFAEIPNNGLPDRQLPAAPFGDRFLGKLYAMVPVKDTERLCVAWAAPTVCDKRLEVPHQLVGFCLAHEGAGSIVDCLRREGLAMDLSCGVGAGGLSDNAAGTLMQMSIRLTPVGLREYRRVLTIVHSYVGMMGSQLEQLRRIHSEVFDIERCGFRFKEEEQPADSAEGVSFNMQRLPRDMWLLGDRLARRYDPQLVRDYWSHLRPANCCALLVSRSLQSSCDSSTDWFGVSYGQLPVGDDQLRAWERCVSEPDAELLAACQLHLPPPNEFVPTNFSVPSFADACGKLGLAAEPQHPVRLRVGDPKIDRYGSLFYLKDQKFSTPRAVVFANVDSPAICESLRNSTLAPLWAYLVKFQLHRETYAATEAHLSYELDTPGSMSLRIKVEGFSDKLFNLYDLIVAKMCDIGAMFRGKDPLLKFDFAKEEVRKSMVNGLLVPKKFSAELRLFCLEQRRFLRNEQLACLEGLTVDDVAEFHRRLLSEAFVKVYVHGNYGPEEAKSYFKRTVSMLQPDCAVAHIKEACAALPVGRSGLRVRNLLGGDVNSVVAEYFQFSRTASVRESALADLLLHIMAEPCFDFLRTKLQLGYHVLCDTRQTHGVLGFIVLVVSQADKFDMQHLQDSVDKFMKEFAVLLAGLSPEKFSTYVESLIELKRTDDVTMVQQADRNFAEIADDSELFDRRAREVQQLQNFCKADVVSCYGEALSAEKRRSFTFQIEGSKVKELNKGPQQSFSLPLQHCEPAECNGGILWAQDLQKFKSSLTFLPARPIVQ